MQKSLIISLLLILGTLFVISCTDNNTNNMAQFGEEVTIDFGETVNIGASDLLFRLDSINEGRCPIDVVCVWQGQATAYFTKTESITLTDFNLNILGLCDEDCGDVKEIGTHQVEIIELNPYPISTNPVTPANYQATIIVTEI